MDKHTKSIKNDLIKIIIIAIIGAILIGNGVQTCGTGEFGDTYIDLDTGEIDKFINHIKLRPNI